MMQARFKNIDVTDGAATLRWTPGIQPSSTSVRLARAPKAGDEGVFMLTDGFGKMASVTMVVESVEQSSTVESGTGYAVVLKDLRAFWKFGSITGRYNQPDATGAPTQEKNLRELAEMCLEAMPRIRSYSAGKLPADEYPAVEWIWENPADALEALLGDRFSIVFGFDGKVEIYKANDGFDYKSTKPYLSSSLKTRREQEYDGVIVVGDRSIRQVTRVLMPMSKDVDGKWKALKDLSYAPDKSKDDGGFGTYYARDPGFTDLQNQYDKTSADYPKIIEGFSYIFRVYGGIPADELPLLSEICEKEFDENGVERYKAPYLVGPLMKYAFVNGVPVTEVFDGPLDGYQIDHQHGLVTFQEIQYQPVLLSERLDQMAELVPAHIYLVYSYEAKAEKDTDVYRYGDLKAKTPLVIKKSELKLREKWPRTVYPLVQIPPPYQKEYGWTALNKADLDEYAKKVYDSYKAQDEDVSGGSITLIGLRRVIMDGLFRSATFTVGPQGSTTEIEWGIETPKIEIPTYKERMRTRALEAIVKAGGSGAPHLGALGKAITGFIGGVARSFGAVGKQVYETMKPAFDFQKISDLVLVRNTAAFELPAGCPFAFDANNPMTEGIWNVIPLTVTGPYIPGISVSTIPVGKVGYGRMPAWGLFLIDTTSVPNVIIGSPLRPMAMYYAWAYTTPPACAWVVYKYPGSDIALVYVVGSPVGP